MKSTISRMLITGLVLLFAACSQKQTNTDYKVLIMDGEFSKARVVINEMLKENNLSDKERKNLQFEIERMDRIKNDFTKTEEEVREFIKEYIPDVSQEDMAKWEKEKSLEMRYIDGEKRYFNRAARNLFRINKECLEIWNKHHESEPTAQKDPNALDLDKHIQEIMAQTKTGEFVKPVRMKIDYSITVNPNTVPENKIIRCWIPYPREIENRQTDIKFISSSPAEHKIAENSALQRTIYLEQPSAGDNETRFDVVYEYTSYGTYTDIDPDKVQPVDPTGPLAKFLKEEPPHIVFTEELKSLSSETVGAETNPYRIAQKLFEWVDVNIPWASAREYSTIRDLSMYPFINRHGDCGIQTMMFMTLCRINGIPTRWQSGWEFQPPDDSMHDWGMIYFEPYGWVPMDVTYGLRKTDNEKHKWFYLSGMDSYRLIFNDDYSQEFNPPKKYFRSETVDSQRGEVEWEEGNLYFDQWDWNMKWTVLAK
jgi:transglutaminase-like putative cysteine protease